MIGNYFKRIFNAIYTFGGSLSKPMPDLREAWNAFLSKVGINVNKQNALAVTAVFACIRIIAENIASLPLYVYETTPDGKRKADERFDYITLHDVANPEMDSFQFWQCFITNACLYGKAFAEIVRNGAGQVAELWPIPTPYVMTQRNPETNELEYIVNTPTGEPFLLRREQVLSLTWFSEDGINPFKPLQLAQNAIGLNIATEEFGSNYFKNGANVSGVIEYPANYTDEQYTRFRKSVREAYAGLSNSAKLMFLEEGSKFNKISNNPEESQMLETRKFQVEEIARFYNVPPHMIMQLERATFCLPADVEVYTQNGPKRIVDIQQGEMV